MIEILNMDCMDLMAKTPDKFYDLAIVDPPYGIKESAHRNVSRQKLAKTTNYKKEFWDFTIPSAEYFSELQRVSKNQIIWGGNYFLDYLGATRCFLVWDKVNVGTNFADCELAWTSFSTSVRLFSFMWNGMMQGSSLNGKKCNPIKAENQKRIHPTEKPVKLYEWILKNYSKEWDKILDTHSGSASHARAVHNMNTQHGMNLSLTATEIDTDYYNESVKRFEQHKRQLKLI